MPNSSDDSPLPRPESLTELFFAFTRLALQGFGGVLPIAQRELVERRRWLGKQDFVDMLSLGQVLPGPNIINVSLMVGDRFFGWKGAAVAVAGMLLFPLLIVLGLAALYTEVLAHPLAAGALRGMGAVAAGLVIATALKLVASLKRSPLGQVPAALLALATLAMIAGLRWPLLWVLAGLGPPGIALAWWRLKR
ncbi:chromate transporter [Schlegelella sp. S2-27]|uniref:Chromate transporter n=1 Tax=Caldimonas mangrovi TaxID=2944811 RepID=A0ABT0YTF3_9BURK|nr:chromate transporter [Caldimonas mangrovi]MCM5682015.1 chromate transporter [Caldimonas mangrovi]